jgi:CSLREA domain-containing protein
LTSTRRARTLRKRLLSTAVLAAMALFASATHADAATLTVTTTTDGSHGSCTVSVCSLRDAVGTANAASEEDTIRVPAGHYTLGEGELVLTNSHRVTLEGAGARTTTIDANGESRVLEVSEPAVVSIADLTLTGGAPTQEVAGPEGEEEEYGPGGAILSFGEMTLDRSVVSDSIAEYGGAIFAAGSLDVEASSLSGNRATYQGGAAEVNGATVLRNSTLTGNESNSSLALSPMNRGGGENGGAITSYGSTELTGSTIAGNALHPGPTAEGAGIAIAAGTVTASDSIVAENTGASQCVAGRAASVGPNIDSDSSCFTGPHDLHADPLLGGLADNGGPTDTMAPGSSSPVLTVGEACDAFDQRGIARPTSHCDLGAYELTAPPVQSTPPASSLETPTAGVTGAKLVPAPLSRRPAPAITFRLRTLKGGAIGLTVSVSDSGHLDAIVTEERSKARAAGALVLLPGKERFGYTAAAVDVTSGRAAHLVLKPTKAGLAMIHRHHRHGWALHVRVTVVFTTADGTSKTSTQTLLVFPARHRHR